MRIGDLVQRWDGQIGVLLGRPKYHSATWNVLWVASGVTEQILYYNIKVIKCK